MSVSKHLLSESLDGRQIKVSATATPGTLIHAAPAGTASLDEVWVYVSNTGTSAVALTLEWGGVSNPDDLVIVSIPPKDGRHLIVDGKLIRNGLEISAFANVADVLVIDGFVNRISE